MNRQDQTHFDAQDMTGAELSEQELDQVAGGGDTDPPVWPPKTDNTDDTGIVHPPQPVPIGYPPPTTSAGK